MIPRRPQGSERSVGAGGDHPFPGFDPTDADGRAREGGGQIAEALFEARVGREEELVVLAGMERGDRIVTRGALLLDGQAGLLR